MNIYSVIGKSFHRREAGFTLPEVGATVVVLGVMAALSAPLLAGDNYMRRDAQSLLEANFKLARIKAMANTTAFRIRPNSDRSLILEKHQPGAGTAMSSCADAGRSLDENGKLIWATAPGFNPEDMILPEGVTFESVGMDGTDVSDLSEWTLCFDSRGMASNNLMLTLEDSNKGEVQTLEVFSSGSLNAQDSARYKKAKTDKGHGNNCDGVDADNPGYQGDEEEDDDEGKC